jgi:hypothetical protein
MAEREGFEPPGPSRAQRFSRPPQSTTLPPLRRSECAHFPRKRAHVQPAVQSVEIPRAGTAATGQISAVGTDRRLITDCTDAEFFPRNTRKTRKGSLRSLRPPVKSGSEILTAKCAKEREGGLVWILQNPRPSAPSAEKSVVELDLWIEADSVLSVSSCKFLFEAARLSG